MITRESNSHVSPYSYSELIKNRHATSRNDKTAWKYRTTANIGSIQKLQFISHTVNGDPIPTLFHTSQTHSITLLTAGSLLRVW